MSWRFLLGSFSASPRSSSFLSVAEVLDGKCDHIPEQCFVYKGAIEDVYAAYDAMQKEED